MTVRARPAATAAVATVALMLLTGCGAGVASQSGSPSSRPDGSSPPASPSAAPAKLTCQNMIPAATVKAFTAAGWTPQEGPFYAGDTRLTGLQCTWGSEDSSSELFGWSPITKGEARTAQRALLAQGWRTVDGTKDVVITAGSGMIVNPDADGYGMTYEFGDGWVKVASTRQDLLLIDGPH